MSLPQLLTDYGYLAVFVASLLEGKTILVLAGFAAHQDPLSLHWVVLLACCGGTIGDLGWRGHPRIGKPAGNLRETGPPRNPTGVHPRLPCDRHRMARELKLQLPVPSPAATVVARAATVAVPVGTRTEVDLPLLQFPRRAVVGRGVVQRARHRAAQAGGG